MSRQAVVALIAALVPGVLLQLLPAVAGAAAIERVEPPNWWVGMRHPQVQLMVHGEGIGAAVVALDRADVRVLRTTRVASPNYLFIDLEIAPDAPAGPLDIAFRIGEQVLHHAYALDARAPGSAERVGFDGKDVILNLMPDRFANGDPGNDRVAGLPDATDRRNPGARHGGDIQGLVEHLDYIAGMGFTMVWPTPLIENNQPSYSYHGYSATDLYRIDPRFGSNDDYRRFVAAARAKGLGVIQDVVPNHIGSGHWWMRDLPTPDWVTNSARFVPTHHNRNAVTDPYAAQADLADFTGGWFAPTMPDMNHANPLVATYSTQNTIWWIESAGLSGLRVDTFGYSNAAFLAAWTQRILDEYPRFSLVGEEWTGNPVMVSHWSSSRASGTAVHMPSMMDFPVSEGLRRALTDKESQGTGLTELYGLLVNDNLYANPGRLVVFEGNHDMARLYSVLGEDLDLYRMALVYIATIRGIPQLYYGTEVLMTSPVERDDGKTRNDFPGGWAGDRVNAFTGAGLSSRQAQAQAFVRALLNWRKGEPAMHHGRLVHFAPRDGVYVYFRYDDQQRYMIVLNKNRKTTALALDRFKEMLGGYAQATEVIGDGTVHALDGTLEVPARAAWILRLEP